MYNFSRIIILIILSILISNCSGNDYDGEYTDGGNKIITIDGDFFLVMYRVDGGWESNRTNLSSVTETDELVIFKGETDYSGGSGSAFGVTIKPGEERHWTKPFVATINKEEKTIHFDGIFIASSLDMYRWDVNLAKKIE